jgi:hypothetical protein
MAWSAYNFLSVGTNLSWFTCKWVSMVVLGCDSMDCVLHGESSQAGRIKTTRSGLGDIVEEASACITALRISFRSCSGLAMQDSVGR